MGRLHQSPGGEVWLKVPERLALCTVRNGDLDRGCRSSRLRGKDGEDALAGTWVKNERRNDSRTTRRNIHADQTRLTRRHQGNE
jgi:hypothetical protein